MYIVTHRQYPIRFDPIVTGIFPSYVLANPPSVFETYEQARATIRRALRWARCFWSDTPWADSSAYTILHLEVPSFIHSRSRSR
jgi:hypothetical protein